MTDSTHDFYFSPAASKALAENRAEGHKVPPMSTFQGKEYNVAVLHGQQPPSGDLVKVGSGSIDDVKHGEDAAPAAE